MRKYMLIPLMLLAVVCLTGCGKQRVDLNVASQPNVNPDSSGRPSPVHVKVFELRNDLAFKQADFGALFANPISALGADLIAADDLVLIPGEARKISYKPNLETRYIGMLAGFRQMDRATWRMSKPIAPEDRTLIALELNDTTILILPDKQAEDWDPEEAVKEYQQRMIRPETTQSQSGASKSAAGAQRSSAATSKSEYGNKAASALQKKTTLGGVSQAEPSLPSSSGSASSASAASPVRIMRPF